MVSGFDENNGASLLVQGGQGDGSLISLISATTTIGRQHDNDVVIDDASVSRRHASIIDTGSGYMVRDLVSTNGTFLNRQRIEGEKPLKHGDVIRAGGSDTTFVFHDSMVGLQTVKVSTVDTATAMQQGVYVDNRSREVYIDGELLDPALPRKEFDLLSLLYSRRGEAISRDDIAAEVWSERGEGDVGNHEIEQCVHRVRARIEKDTSSPEHLVTIRGFGYRFG